MPITAQKFSPDKFKQEHLVKPPRESLDPSTRKTYEPLNKILHTESLFLNKTIN